MSVLVVGMSHQSAPVALLEKLSMDETVQNDTCRAMVSAGSLSEAMIISTCNRLEVYTVTNSFHTGVQDVVRNLADVSGVEEEKLRSYLYVRYADAAAEHLMMVASGLDSMVVGEQQIIGQVRTAYQFASEQGTVGPRIHALAQSALRTGKRVHSETEIDEAGSSMVSFAFDQALSRMGREDLAGKRVLILGAGAMASLAATHAGRLGAQLIIANRTIARAERVAQHAHEAGVYADVIDFSERAQALRDVDVAISATGAQGFTITAADVERYHVADRELMLVDLSLPRDIDDAVAEVEGATPCKQPTPTWQPAPARTRRRGASLAKNWKPMLPNSASATSSRRYQHCASGQQTWSSARWRGWSRSTPSWTSARWEISIARSSALRISCSTSLRSARSNSRPTLEP